MPSSRYYVTTSIPYVNARPHLGHALEAVQADVLARYHRQRGDDTRFLTGTDDNSLKNVLAAEAEGLPVAALVDRNAAAFEALREPLALSFDDFIRTSRDPRHRAAAEKLWRACTRSGDIYRRMYSGLYCVGCEQFYRESELIDGQCPEHGTVPELVEEENWFFRLSRYAEQLREIIGSGRLRILPESRRNEVLRFIEGGLDDFSISRSWERARGWGITVPDDPSQVMYVWFDALTNYIAALDYASHGVHYERYWRQNANRVHVIGKGILRFHAVYWPAMLLAAGEPLPGTVYVHEYLTVQGQKISKSLGNIVDPVGLAVQFGTDALRYWLLRDVPRTEDADFTVERLVERYNADLANDLGNLVQRTLSMLQRYRNGVVPASDDDQPADSALVTQLPARVETALDDFDFRAALVAVWELVTRTNRLVEEAAPWVLARQARDGDIEATHRLDHVLYSLAESVRLIGYHLTPFLPGAGRAVAAQLGLEELGRPSWGDLRPGTLVGQPRPIFPRLEPAGPVVAGSHGPDVARPPRSRRVPGGR